MLPLRHPQRSETFGEALQRHRNDKKTSVSKQAKELNVSKELYRAWEADQAVPESVPFKRLVHWCKALGDWNDLVTQARAAGFAKLPEREKCDNGHSEQLEQLLGLEHMHLETFTFGQALQRLRLNAGLSVGDLADMVGCTMSQWRDWEADRAAPLTQDFAELISIFPSLDARYEIDEPIERYALIDNQFAWLGGPGIPTIPKEVPQMDSPTISTEAQHNTTVNFAHALADVAASSDRGDFVMVLKEAHQAKLTPHMLHALLKVAKLDQLPQFRDLLHAAADIGIEMDALRQMVEGSP